MKEFDIKLAKTVQMIESSELYVDTAEICKEFNEKHILFLTCWFGISVAVAIADKKLYESESQFITDSIPKGIKLDSRIKRALVELNLSKGLLHNGFSTTLPHYVSYLKATLKEEDMVKIIKMLFTLACADGEFNPQEEKLIIKIARRAGLQDQKIAKIRDYCIENKLFKVDDDKEITILKNLTPLKQKFEKKRFIQPFKTSIALEYEEKLAQSPLFYFIKQSCPNTQIDDLLFITSYLGTAFSFIASDNVVHEKEVSYIKSEFKQWYDLRTKTVDTLIDINIYLLEKKTQTEKFNDLFLEILSKLFDKQEKERFTIMLFNLADSDSDVSPIELLLVEKISKAFDLGQDKVNDIKDQAIGLDGSFKIIRSASTWDMMD